MGICGLQQLLTFTEGLECRGDFGKKASSDFLLDDRRWTLFADVADAVMAESGKSDSQLWWIYEGTKSLVNREDYLLGKKVLFCSNIDPLFTPPSDTLLSAPADKAVTRPEESTCSMESSPGGVEKFN